MRKSIFIKLFLGFLIPIIILQIIILIIIFNSIRDYDYRNLNNNIEEYSASLKHPIIYLINKNEHDTIEAYLKKAGAKTTKRITIIDVNKNVIADSELKPQNYPNIDKRLINNESINEALLGDTSKKEIQRKGIETKTLIYSVPLRFNPESEKVNAVLIISTNNINYQTFRTELETKILLIIILTLFICIIIAIWFYTSFSNPIKLLVDASGQVAAGNFDTRVFLENKGELNILANNFNYMVSQLKELFADLSNQKEELKTIIESLQVALIVLDKEGRIAISNNSFKKIVNYKDIDNKYYWKVLREFHFNKVLEELKGKESYTTEIEMIDKIYLCSCSKLSSDNEAVLILSDISEIKRLEKIKKDFVTNVTHELRTPLTAIKGFVETILDEEVTLSTQNHRYLEIILRHTDRLTYIVRDLLLLSELEEGSRIDLKFEKVNLVKLVDYTIKIFEHKLKEKELKLYTQFEDNIPIIQADPFSIEQVLINLISNAIRYTEEGYIKVYINKKPLNYVEIIVEDTGIGIDKKEIDRIFERFYVVNKSRSKQTGGTGLGLSIVKHIVLLHNGKIDVISQLGKGTRFIIELPAEHT
jgi:two-component system, OmpR family, phosphate regulon sensor histidine kinase PhoR